MFRKTEFAKSKKPYFQYLVGVRFRYMEYGKQYVSHHGENNDFTA